MIHFFGALPPINADPVGDRLFRVDEIAKLVILFYASFLPA
jgi:hypothetical protein